ncbi:FadR/GntR family transcriptional regulator [Vibrio splendidus]|jgi:DNA-binding FadR family transcriptional regulator|uniref:FadR family transcriptional regulator n=2 Tax=Vibrio TaxID=662 RepID=A0A2N7KSX7_VIBSP|nr:MULTISPECIES: FadR/GntR family transcriptional regulator [Vibrio]MCQ8866814.1 FadR family transcriptional regulator [Vibrio splendidus]MDH5933343.1 FadR family transcriptional regulator [Vibrio splendidus]MDP2490116.1 FadR/GntR family transcriptional regulator [Vibrio splendidus]MDP2501325.1 FadR/GntR family transcriptional regulator [Vibrio splendidus]OEF73376.1 GntR family transcriptional regulator [Vibrio splendidus 1F-157]
MVTTFNSISGSKRSLHVQVAREIARGILSGELPQGSIIPGEMALCEQFGISRTALREAVKLLTSKGLLESRPKIGTRVVDRAYWNFLDPQLIEWMDGLTDVDQFCSQFLGLRRAIEPEACALAAKFATAEQRIELSEIFQKMVEVDEAEVFDQERWTDIDTRFHSLIFNATGNDFYLPFGNILTTMFINFIVHSSEEGSTCINEHRRIYEAIMAGDSDKARVVSAAHLQDANHRLATA